MTVLTVDSLVETHSSCARTRTPSWFRAAALAHALLTQSLPDELLDDISAGPSADQAPFLLPAVLVG